MGAPYIYDISHLRVNRVGSVPETYCFSYLSRETIGVVHEANFSKIRFLCPIKIDPVIDNEDISPL